VEHSWPEAGLSLGACYYPEHWDESLWESDFSRMREHGLSLIRIGEFAWSIFEPEEERFQFDLFDRALALAQGHGLRVIMGTPTATPPAWLTAKYPQVLNVSREGIQYQHGQRRHYNYNAAIYRKLVARVVAKLAEHFGPHPALIGWQIDNELNCEVNVFYSRADHAAFRVWLQERYGSLERLNEAWGAVFWNQTYSSWDQVHLTRPTVSDSPNPHQALDEKRFFSQSAIDFARLQADILRRLAPRQWVTTNGLFGHLDSHRLTEEALDFISYDSYPNFAAGDRAEESGSLLDRRWSWNLSLTRDISPRFCVMEQQSGPNGWVNRMASPSPRPGQLRLWTMQSIAHGADAVLYFRWRTATMGTEIYWHGIYNYDNRENRRVREVRQTAADLARISSRVAGTRYQAQVAILHDYDNEWDGELDMWHGPCSRQSNAAWFAALQHKHIPTDVVTMRDRIMLDDLRPYRLLVYPHPAILTDRTADLLASYVRQGGYVVLGCRTGYKDEDGRCPMRPMPGPVAELCGMTVDDFTLVGPGAPAPSIRWADHAAPAVEAILFNDILVPTSNESEVLGRYFGSYYNGEPAVTLKAEGKGHVLYYGAAFTEAAACVCIELSGQTSPAAGLLDLPDDVELAIRQQPDSGGAYWFLLNYADREQAVNVRGDFLDLLTEKPLSGTLMLPPYGAAVLGH
jgi:beta-galactosidase